MNLVLKVNMEPWEVSIPGKPPCIYLYAYFQSIVSFDCYYVNKSVLVEYSTIILNTVYNNTAFFKFIT